ncbi:MAG: UMP kinase [Alphaproteobacteria bacterium]|nr:UMP kinase [Alphaproteobacteria bacterium]MBQ9234856.1 UMP kinase [Alphaproteobacteria bacterium]
MKAVYKRVLFKLSGEGLAGPSGYGVDVQAIQSLAAQIKDIISSKVEVCIVIGGGNIFRGAKDFAAGLDRSQADQVGMLATVMNAVFLRGALSSVGVEAVVLSGLSVPKVCEDYNFAAAMEYLRQGKVVIFAGGTGNPYFTTDTGAVLRAVEMHCDVVLKSSQVDGVYSADPNRDASAVKYDVISYDDFLSARLKVMDLTAVALAAENNLPIVVFSQHDADSLLNIIRGKGSFSVIKHQK